MNLNILPLVLYIVRDYSLLGSTADFRIKKGTSRISPSRKVRDVGRNMAVELDSGHPLLPNTGREYDDLTLIWRGSGNFVQISLLFADTSAFRNTKTNKIMCTIEMSRKAVQQIIPCIYRKITRFYMQAVNFMHFWRISGIPTSKCIWDYW